jgi:signal transduction histidine kinase
VRTVLRSWMSVCVVAVACTGTTLLLRLALSGWLDQPVPLFLPLVVAVFAAAAYAGLRAGLLTTFLCVVLGATLFAVPAAQNTTVASSQLSMLMFLVEGLAISFCFEAVHHARNRLLIAARRKNEFLATLAHELRNPLAPIRNCLELLRLAGNDPVALAQTHSIMERQVNQMVRLVDDLLDVSRIDRNKLELRREQVHLAEIVHRAVETSRPLIDAKAHQLTITLPPQPILLHADQVRLTQVLSNLLNNAAKYTEEGGHIRLTVEQEGGEVVVKVQDSGIGIPTDMLPKIFEMFTQVDQSLERSQGGLGIGLTLVKWLVEMHGGSVEARSDGPGRGSELMVRLPVLLPLTAPKSQRSNSSTGETGARQRRRILVVDDNEDAAITLGTMLKEMGNQVCVVHDGVEAVATAASFQPDVVFLDIRMPRMNGHDAARRIREEPWGKEMVLIAQTGWGQEEDRLRSTEAGFDYHLVKPVAATTLHEILAGLKLTCS